MSGSELKVEGHGLERDGFMVNMEFAHEQAHAISLLTARLIEHPDMRSEDLEIFATYALGEIGFAEYRHRIETGEATL